MFWRKKESISAPPFRVIVPPPSQHGTPRPILKTQPDSGLGSPSIRFAGEGPCLSYGAQASPSPPRSSSVSSSSSGGSTFSRDSLPATRPQRPSMEHYASHSHSHNHYQPHSAPPTSAPNPAMRAIAGSTAGRKSSRPTSPSASSFGARVRTASEPIQSIHSSQPASVPLTTPPMPSASHVTTPPMAYVSTLQSRAPPPPSPYRPTTTADRRPISRLEALPFELAPRPPRSSSLYETPSAPGRIGSGGGGGDQVCPFPGGAAVPMLNVIPATPQDSGEEFGARGAGVAGGGGVSPVWRKRRVSQTSLEEAVRISEGRGEMEDVPLEPAAVAARAGSVPASRLVSALGLMETETMIDAEYAVLDSDAASIAAAIVSADLIPSSSLPAIDVRLDFSPFEPLVGLPGIPTSTSMATITRGEVEEGQGQAQSRPNSQMYARTAARISTPPTDPLPPSPPFESYSSLPSLLSQTSMPSSSSEDSMPTSSSTSSLVSFPDVEEALGSMLASLSDSIPDIPLAYPGAAGPASSIPAAEVKRSSATPTSSTPAQRGGSGNPGLGLGLDIPESTSSITAPLAVSPRRRPPPLDLALAKRAAGPTTQTAPPRINHRVAFYGTARAHPNSPTSGVFQQFKTPQGVATGFVPGPGHAHPETETETESGGYEYGHSYTASFSSTHSHSHSSRFGAADLPSSDSGESMSRGSYSSHSSRGSNESVTGVFRESRSGSGSATASASASGILESFGFAHGHAYRDSLSRDSISLASEASDDDLHTASIISLTPVMGERGVVQHVHVGVGVGEEVLGEEVGLAL